MTSKRRDPKAELSLLAEALVADILDTSDEEILAEAAEDYGDIDTVVERLRQEVERAVAKDGKRRMRRAKAGVAARKPLLVKKVSSLSVERKREIVRQFAEQGSAGRHGKKTLAARKGNDLTDADLDATIEALLMIGAIDEEGNPL